MKTNTTNPLFSIIMPVYNTPSKLLEICVNSIKIQTYKNLELIIVDDGSKKICMEKCDDLSQNDSRIKVIHTPNRGVSNARNTGLKIVKGDYLLFIDSDDEFVPNALETLYQYTLDYKFDFCIYGWYDYVENGCYDHHPNETPKRISSKTFQIGIAGDNFKYGGGYPWNKLWNIHSLKEANNGSIPIFDISIDRYEDKLWALVASNNLKYALLVPEQLYKYNYNENSLSQDRNAIDIRTNKAYIAYNIILDYLEKVNYDAFISGCNFYYEFTQKDLADLYKDKSANKIQIKKSRRALHRICKRIPPRKLYVPINSKDFRTWLFLHYLP